MTILRRLVGLLCLSGCAAEPTSGRGPLDMRLTSPHQASAAVMIRVDGPAIDSITSAIGRVFVTRTGGGVAAIVVGGVAPGVVGRLWVAEPGRVDGYQATVLEAAAPASYQIQSPLEMRLTIEAPG